jgi:hypothetical protein
VGKSKILNGVVIEDSPHIKHNTYKVTLWKVDQSEPAVILAEQKIEVSKDVNVLRNKLNFS